MTSESERHMDRFSAEAAAWDEQPGKVERARAAADAIRRALPLNPRMTALEVGGGTGLLARALSDTLGPVTVTDVAPGMVEAAAAVLADAQYEGWRVAQYDIEHDPLPDERYDIVFSLLALHHMGDVGAVIERMYALLNPGGLVALLDLDHDPDGGFHASVADFDGHHGFARESISGWLEAAGFADRALTTGLVDHKVVDGETREFPLFLATARRPG